MHLTVSLCRKHKSVTHAQSDGRTQANRTTATLLHALHNTLQRQLISATCE